MGTERKKAFLLYCDYKQHLELLSAEECGLLFIALLDYADTRKPPKLHGAAAMAFSFIKAQMDRDNEKYEERCNINRENGSKGGRPRKGAEEKPKETEKTERFFEKAKKADTDNDTEIDTDKGTDIDTDTGIEIEKHSLSHDKKQSTAFQERYFAIFWDAYPNKKAKTNALKAWNKIKPNGDLFDKIMRAVDIQKRSEDWQRENGRFIPYPATWLNGGYWDNEVKEVNTNGEAQHQQPAGGSNGGSAFTGGESRNGTPAGFKSE